MSRVSYTAPLTDVQTTTNSEYVTPQLTANDMAGLPQWTVMTLPDKPEEVATESPVLEDVTRRGAIHALADETSADIEDMSNEAINEIEDVSEEAKHEIDKVEGEDSRMEKSTQEENL